MSHDASVLPMAGRGSRLFRSGAFQILFSKFAWYRKLGYTDAEAARKARWRAGLPPVPGSAGRPAESLAPLAKVPAWLTR